MQIGPRIRFDSHTLGNLAKNLSPAAAFVPGLGLPGTFALSTLGDLGRGKNIGQAAVGAAKNTALAAGARGVAGHFGVLGQGGSAPISAPASSGPSSITGGPTAGPDIGPLPGPTYTSTAAPGAVAPTVQAPSAPGLFSRIATSALDHDKTTGAALNAAGSLVGSGARNRQLDAQTRLLDLEAEQRQQDLERQKQSAQLDPLRGAIYGKLFSNLAAPAGA